jgi:glycolate oxidase iron-sulfur subunit
LTADFSGLDPCVHCGFCLQSCPTYLVTGDESDSPRGRIVLMRSLARDSTQASDDSLRYHLDRCLGCRGCEPVCPSGVRYGPSLEAAREVLASERRPPLAARLVLSTMADPNLRGPAMAAARVIRPLAQKLAGGSRIGFAFGMLAATRSSEFGSRGQGASMANAQHRTPEVDSLTTNPESRAPVVVFQGCIMDGLFSHVNAATARTLAANGYQLTEVPDQGCCGALHAHAGQHERAQELARANVAAFSSAAPDAAIAVNSAGCGAAMKEYGHLLSNDPLAEKATRFSARVRDVSELLAARGPRPGAPLPVTVAYDPPCHLLHAQRIAREPIAVLDAIPQLTRVSHAEAELCCGSAGIYSLLEPELSRSVLARKTDAIQAAAPDVVATGNPGCAMQIGAGLRAVGSRIPVVHPVELLDHSYWAAGLYDE